MAKKVKEDEAEATAFKFPEFDEKLYLREEIRDAKAIIVSALLAIPFAAVAAMITANVHPTAGILLGLAGFAVIFFLFRMLFKDLTGFKAKHWLMSLGGYFLTFLALWILMINPPFMDLTGPVIEEPQYATVYGEFSDIENNLVDLPDGTTTWFVRVSVADNVGLDGMPQLTVGAAAPVPMSAVPGEKGVYEAEVTGIYTLTITAADVHGQDATYEISVY